MSTDEASTMGICRLRVADTNATNAHGNSVIKPGDKVEYEGRMCRVVEVYPEKRKLKVYRVGGMHSSIESIRSEGVTGYEPRE